jgi:hypothetical protein
MATGTAKPCLTFQVVCPYCGDAEGTVRIDLNDLRVCTCSACEEEFTPRTAVKKMTERLRSWEAVARWVEMAGEATADPAEASDETIGE